MTIKVLVLIQDRKGRFLLIKEWSNRYQRFGWNFIRGTYDNHKESFYEAAVREIDEEVGITAISHLRLKLFKVYQTPFGSRAYFVYNCTTKEQPSLGNKVVPGEHIAEYAWFTAEELMKLKQSSWIDSIIAEIAASTSINNY